jgi:AraC-like DNA-binding protein
MKNITMYIENVGNTKSPSDWYLKYTINIQRLYYIKGGTGYIIGEDNKKTRFKPGCIYIFPHNLRHKFETDPTDRIDHIYFDFLSTPPIISPEPLIYEVKPDTPLSNMIMLIDSVILNRRDDGNATFHKHVQKYIADAPSGSIEEICQIIYELLKTLLMLLSHEREIPYASDEMVVSTLEYIRDNYASPIQVGELAARIGFETNYFIRRFRRIMGLTPYAYLRSYRLLRAEELISSGNTVARAAELVGYENASSLSRALKSIKNS